MAGVAPADGFTLQRALTDQIRDVLRASTLPNVSTKERRVELDRRLASRGASASRLHIGTLRRDHPELYRDHVYLLRSLGPRARLR